MSNSKLVETSISDEQRAKARLLNSPLRLLRINPIIEITLKIPQSFIDFTNIGFEEEEAKSHANPKT